MEERTQKRKSGGVTRRHPAAVIQCTKTARELGKRGAKCPCSGARQQGAPLEKPRLTSPNFGGLLVENGSWDAPATAKRSVPRREHRAQYLPASPFARRRRPCQHRGICASGENEGGVDGEFGHHWNSWRPAATTSRRCCSNSLKQKVYVPHKHLKSSNFYGGGHGRREDGHTDKSGTREEAGGDGDARARPGRGDSFHI